MQNSHTQGNVADRIRTLGAIRAEALTLWRELTERSHEHQRKAIALSAWLARLATSSLSIANEIVYMCEGYLAPTPEWRVAMSRPRTIVGQVPRDVYTQDERVVSIVLEKYNALQSAVAVVTGQRLVKGPHY